MYVFLTLISLGIDQITKILAILKLKQITTVPIFENILHLTYSENKGAAFGILQNQRLFFIIITFVFLLVLFHYYKDLSLHNINMSTKLGFALLFIGAIGNLIDRIHYGYVIDFIDFRLINFPIFNIADIYIFFGVILVIRHEYLKRGD